MDTSPTAFFDSGGFSHLFYVGNSGNIHEMYGSFLFQYDHLIGAPVVAPPGQRDDTALNSQWDGSVEHVYYLVGGALWETYYDTSAIRPGWHSAQLSQPGQAIPMYPLQSSNQSGYQHVYGLSWTPGFVEMWVDNPPGGSQCRVALAGAMSHTFPGQTWSLGAAFDRLWFARRCNVPYRSEGR
jgi:hypothetical protein